MDFGKAARRRLTLATVPRESDQVDRLVDNSRQMVRLDRIDDNPRNPRTAMDEEQVAELAQSIAEHGLLQAPVVRRNPEHPDRYLVVLGARRIAAHRLLGREEIEVIVRRLDDQRAFLASCAENLQRVALTPQEEMDLVGVLMEELGSQEAAARALGKSASWLSKRKRVLAQPVLAAAVTAGEITLDHAYDVLTHAETERAMLTHLRRIKAGEQSQDQTRAARREQKQQAEPQGETGAPIPVRERRPPAMPHQAMPESPARQEPKLHAITAPATSAPLPTPSSEEPLPRNPASTPAGRKGDKVVLNTLAIVRLAKEHGKRAPRAAVLAALWADIEQLS
jgi:ParB family chromosome partitioning protein